MMDVWESLELSRIKAQNQHLARSREDAFAQLDAAGARIAELEAKVAKLIEAGDVMAAILDDDGKPPAEKLYRRVVARWQEAKGDG